MERKRRALFAWWFVVGLLAVTAMVVPSGCGWFAARPPLVVVLDEQLFTLDPHLHNHSVTWSALNNLHDTLVRFSPEMKLEPALAVSWERLDASHLRMRLRPDVRFSDGTEFTADDVIASFERARGHPRSLVRHYLVGINAVRKESDTSIIVEASGASPNLLNRLTFLVIVPRALAGNDEIVRPVGTGPYRLADREADGSLVLEGWSSWRGVPEISRVILRFREDELEATDLFFSGKADVLRFLPDDQVSEAKRHAGLAAVAQPRLAAQLVAIAPRAAVGETARALADVRVRRALLLALDRAGWIERVYRGNGTVASQYVHPVVFGYDPSVTPVPYDPSEAKRLLREAGFPNGFEVSLGHGSVRSGIIEAIIADLDRVGVRVQSRALAFEEAMRLARAGELPLFYYAWACSTGDATEFLNTSVHRRQEAGGLGFENFGGFSDPTVDALLDAADRELDTAKRLALLQQAQRRVLSELPVLPLTIRWGFLGVSSRVEVTTRHDERIWIAGFRWRE